MKHSITTQPEKFDDLWGLIGTISTLLLLFVLVLWLA